MIHLNKYFAILLFITLTVSCSNEKPTFNKFSDIKLLKGKQLEIDQDVLMSSNRILLIDTILVVLENKRDKFLCLFDIHSGKLICEGGTKGRGPGELITPWTLFESNLDNSFIVFDATARRFNYFFIDSLIINPNFKPSIRINLNIEYGMLSYPLFISDSILVSPGIFSDGRLIFFDTQGNFIKKTGEIPNKKLHRNAPDEIIQQAYQSVMSIDPNKEKIAILTRYSDRLELYNNEGIAIKTVMGPIGFVPKFIVGNAMGDAILVQDQSTRFGYIEVVSDDKFIYALYSGKTRSENPGKANFGKFIFKFDWNGNPISMYELDDLVLSITLDRKHNIIYGLKEDTIPKIISYQF